jgi:hypothetical protein
MDTNKTTDGTDDRCIERIMFLWAMIALLVSLSVYE